MWKSKKLCELCDIQSGLWTGKNEPFTKALVLRNTNFTASGKFDYSNVVELEVETKQLVKREVIKNDIILEKSGGGEKTPVGRVCIHDAEANIPYSLSNFTARLRVIDGQELDAQFLHRFLYFLYISGKTEPMQRHSTGIRNLQLAQYKDIDVPLPPLAEQKRIVAKLDAAFAEIDRAIEATKSSSLELGMLREKIVATEMLKHANSNDAITKLLAEVCDLQNGYAFKSKDYVDSSNTLNIRMSNIRPNGDFDANHNARFLPDSYADEYSQFLLNEGDLIIAMTDMAGDPKILGVPTLVTGLQERNFLLNQRVGRLWKFSEDVYVPFLSRFLTTLKSYYKSKGAGGLQINISKKEILSATIHLPPYEEQVKSVERIDSLLALCSRNEHTFIEKLDSLSTLKASVLAQELQPPQSEAA